MQISRILYIPDLGKWQVSFLEDKEAEVILLDEETIVSFQLIQGVEITREVYTEIIAFESVETNYKKALDYLHRRRTIAEMYTFLEKKQRLENTVCTQIVEKLIAQHYLDDEAYAKAYIHDQLNFHRKSFTQTLRKLKEKGIVASECIETIHYWYQNSQTLQKKECENLEIEIQQSMKKLRHYQFREQKQRIIAKMLQKGYNKDAIESILQDYHEIDALTVYEKQKLLEKSRSKLYKMKSASAYAFYMNKYNISKEEAIAFFNQERMNSDDQ